MSEGQLEMAYKLTRDILAAEGYSFDKDAEVRPERRIIFATFRAALRTVYEAEARAKEFVEQLTAKADSESSSS